MGEAAKQQAARNAKGTVYDAKRLIGRLASDATVKADERRWPFRVAAGEGGKAMIAATAPVQPAKFSTKTCLQKGA